MRSSAFVVVLHRYTSSEEIALDVSIDSSCLVAEVRFDGNPSFREVLRCLNEGKRSAVRKASHSVGFRFGSHFDQEGADCDLDLKLKRSSDGMAATIRYNAERFDAFHMKRLAGHFQTILRAGCLAPDEAVELLPILAEDERKQIIVDWNATGVAPDNLGLIQQGFEQFARTTPDAIAIVAGGREYSYRQIDEQANRLAHYLKAQGVIRGAFVGVCVRRSKEMIVAVLAVLKADAAYAPLDASYPKDRLAFMLDDLRAPAVLTESALLERLPTCASKYFCLDRLSSELQCQPSEKPESAATLDDRAYVIYTSGSTGRPKGVILRHRPVANVLNWVNETFEVRPSDQVLFVTSLSFDLSVYDIFGVLGAGGSIRVASEAELRDPAQLLHIMRTEPITIWDSAPAALAQLTPFIRSKSRSNAGGFDVSRLRLVLLSGDWIPVAIPDVIRAAFSNARVVSLGGATEAAIWSNWYPIESVDPKWPSIPYGKPIRNARYYVLDRRLQPVPVGVPGDLYIGGDVLADGYLNREELTKERFIRDPFYPAQNGRLYKTGDLARYFADGNLEFLGRADTQVKIRGFRVEAGEIEAVIGQVAGVSEVAVKAFKDGGGQNYLIAYISVDPVDRTQVEAGLAAHLSATLPEYMVPAHSVFLPASPLDAQRQNRPGSVAAARNGTAFARLRTTGG